MSSYSWSTPTYTQLLTTILLLLVLLLLTLANLTLPRLYRLLTSSPPRSSTALNDASQRTQRPRGHLLIILGSGGHTAEMFSILRNLGQEYLDARFARRTWVVSSGDGFSVGRAVEFEAEMERERMERKGEKEQSGEVRNNVVRGRSMESNLTKSTDGKEKASQQNEVVYTITTVRRARKVHQPLLTTPISSLGCLWDCIRVLRGSDSTSTSTSQSPSNDMSQASTHPSSPTHTNTRTYNHNYPDLILTNGPGTGVIMVLASLILLFLGIPPISSSTSSSAQAALANVQDLFGGDQPAFEPKLDNSTETKLEGKRGGAMRTIYIESWARVKSLSLSARILRFMASRVLVQWREVGGGGGGGGGQDAVIDLTRVNVAGGQDADADLTKLKVLNEEKGENEDTGQVGTVKERHRERDKKRVKWPRKLEYVGAIVT